MLVLTLRTDNPEAEVGLFNDQEKISYQTWPAHRELADTLHNKIEDLLKKQKKDWQDIQGIVVFKGPGSFTGLRIGLTVANTLACALNIPVIGEMGEGWTRAGINRLKKDEQDLPVMPEYGAPVHITIQKR